MARKQRAPTKLQGLASGQARGRVYSDADIEAMIKAIGEPPDTPVVCCLPGGPSAGLVDLHAVDPYPLRHILQGHFAEVVERHLERRAGVAPEEKYGMEER